jgi:hypothetical protein
VKFECIEGCGALVALCVGGAECDCSNVGD